MANVVAARLVPWEPVVPGIAYELDDGTIGCIAGNLASTVPGLKSKLSVIDRCQFEDQMNQANSEGSSHPTRDFMGAGCFN